MFFQAELLLLRKFDGAVYGGQGIDDVFSAMVPSVNPLKFDYFQEGGMSFMPGELKVLKFFEMVLCLSLKSCLIHISELAKEKKSLRKRTFGKTAIELFGSVIEFPEQQQ